MLRTPRKGQLKLFIFEKRAEGLRKEDIKGKTERDLSL